MPITLTRIVRTGLVEHGVDAGDARRVDDVRAAGRELGEPLEVEDVALGEAEVRMVGELGAGESVAVEVVDRDDLVLVDEPWSRASCR